MNQPSQGQQPTPEKESERSCKWIVDNKLMVIVTCVFLLVLGLGVWWFYSEWECTGDDLKSKEQLTKTFHDLGVLVGGFIAIWVAIWRSVVANRQAKALKEQVTALKEQVVILQDQAKQSQDQVKTSQDQARTSQQGLLNERYQKAAEMLGGEVLSVRLGGIYALQRLAEDEPDRYHLQITRLFCAFVSHPTEDKKHLATLKASKQYLLQRREDVHAALTMIATRSDAGIELEKNEKFRINLAGAFLVRADLTGADLTGADMAGANLTSANLTSANLTSANLMGAHLTGADLTGAPLAGAILAGAKLGCKNLPDAKRDDPRLAEVIEPIRDNTKLDEICLAGANLTSADLAGAILSNAKGLTQDQLDQACAAPDNPPHLGSLCDAKTGKPLMWRGKPCKK